MEEVKKNVHGIMVICGQLSNAKPVSYQPNDETPAPKEVHFRCVCMVDRYLRKVDCSRHTSLKKHPPQQER